MATALTDAVVREGVFQYLRPLTEPSLLRNGKVLTRRNSDGSDGEWVGVDLEPRTMPVRNARALPQSEQCTLFANGFELRASVLPDRALDFLNHLEVVKRYYDNCAVLVKEACGAMVVQAFDHNVRSASGKAGSRRIAGGQQVQGPAHIVHGDYTLVSAPQRLRDLSQPPSGNDTLAASHDREAGLLSCDLVQRVERGARFAIINVWRNIDTRPVAVNPLALCDAARVRPEDLVVFEIHYADRVGENYFARHSERHEWFFYPAMTQDEVLLIKQWDSAGRFARSAGRLADSGTDEAPSTFSFHSAFEDPLVPDDAPDRWSIEVRCIAIYE